MSPIVLLPLTAVVTFGVTNIDDLFVLALFFSQTRSGFRIRHIVAGHYLGFSALVAISLVGFLGGRMLPEAWVGLLGLVPILIGIRRWIQRHDPPFHANVGATASVTTVAVATFANGADNIGVYTPLFASSDMTRLWVTLVIFYVLLAVWCVLGYALTRHPVVARGMARYPHIIVPLILIGLGVYIMVQSGTFQLFGL